MEIGIKKIKEGCGKSVKIIGCHPILFCAFMILLALAISGCVFYYYVFSVQKIEIEMSTSLLSLKEKNYQDILKIWQDQEKKFQEADLKIYNNPFKKPR